MEPTPLILELQKLSNLATSRARRARLKNQNEANAKTREDNYTYAEWNESLKQPINKIIHYLQFYDSTEE
jgi:hypothetical protein